MLQWLISLCPALLLGCRAGEGGDKPRSGVPLAPLADIPEGLTAFKMERIALFRAGPRFRAVSLLCTHQTCLITPEERGFRCPCHGSNFSENGDVITGPAVKPLHWYELSVNPSGMIIVHTERIVGPEWRELGEKS